MTDHPQADRAQTYVVDKDPDKDKREEDARSYFERTGSYRAEDVMAVLGDPREHVDINSRTRRA
jgi:hypothetical protein